MSDLAAAAAAMGIPESLVQRSAEARAAESGASVEEIIAAWAGGGAAPAAAPAEPASAEPTPGDESPQAAEPEPGPEPAPEILIELPAAAAEPTPMAQSGEPPVLVGASDNPLGIMVGAIGLFVLILLVGMVGPSLRVETPGARSSDIQLTAAGEDGMALYSSLGCAACHTQMVRPVVADVGLGAVTLNDANQPLGTRRFGPDLSDVGARISGSQIEALVGGFDGHPPLSLSADDMNALVTYLIESNTSGDNS